MPLLSQVWNNFKLAQGTREQGSRRIGDDGGAAVLSGIIPSEDLEELLQTGIEDAKPDNATGRIRRTLPVSHPKQPNLFIKTVDNITGVSFTEKVEADPEGYLEVPSLPYYADYQKYFMQATFTPRPYAMLSDESIQSYTINYYDDDGNPQTKSAYKEWHRYTEWLRDPHAEFLTADYGQYKWAGAAGTGNHPANPDDGSGFRGQIRQLMPGSTWYLNWYRVPYGYCLSDNSYWERYIGYVNQQAIWGFDAGEALLSAVRVKNVYSPPFPGFTYYTGYDAVSQDKLCDVTFVFETVNRSVAIVVTPTNSNDVVGGHNLAYYVPSRKYYYIESGRSGSKGSGHAIYKSIPFDILFQNPDGPA